MCLNENASKLNKIPSVFNIDQGQVKATYVHVRLFLSTYMKRWPSTSPFKVSRPTLVIWADGVFLNQYHKQKIIIRSKIWNSSWLDLGPLRLNERSKLHWKPRLTKLAFTIGEKVDEIRLYKQHSRMSYTYRWIM